MLATTRLCLQAPERQCHVALCLRARKTFPTSYRRVPACATEKDVVYAQEACEREVLRVVKVVVIGGGMAGLGCLRALSGAAHINTTLFESTRVLGGRVRSMRRLGALSWDHGASHFSRPRVADSPFHEVLQAAEEAGVLELWNSAIENAGDEGRIGTAEVFLEANSGPWVIDHYSFHSGNIDNIAEERYVGIPDMAAIPTFIAHEIVRATRPGASWIGDDPEPGVPEVLTSCYVDRIRLLTGKEAWIHACSQKQWGMMLRVREGGHMWYKPFECDFMLLATNAPTAASLLEAIVVGDSGEEECSRDFESGKRLSCSRQQAKATPWLHDVDFLSGAELNEKNINKNMKYHTCIQACVLELAAAARGVGGNTCWALTVAFDRPLGLPYDAIYLSCKEQANVGFGGNKSSERCPIVFFANNSSKPGRPGGGRGAAEAGWGYRWAEVCKAPEMGAGECWVVHANPDWSNLRSGWTSDDVAKELCAEFLRLIGIKESRTCSELCTDKCVRVCYNKAFKWNHHVPLNRAVESGHLPYLLYPHFGLGLCGDWISGAGADVAYDGGVALGEAVASHLAELGEFGVRDSGENVERPHAVGSSDLG